MEKTNSILVCNAGSSSIKIDMYSLDSPDMAPIMTLALENVGTERTLLRTKSADSTSEERSVVAENQDEAIKIATDWLNRNIDPSQIVAVGHRIVHGGERFTGPEVMNDSELGELRSLIELDPEHLPSAIRLVEAMAGQYGGVPQVGCFDTAFYKDMPRIAKMIPIPRKYEAMGVRRYGFHGLSYEYLMNYLKTTCGETASMGRVICAHLGSGVSMTAIKNGIPVDTTMGFTPASGVMMSKRSGDIDPGLIPFLERQTHMSTEEIYDELTQKSGLLGVSETTPDMYDLLQSEGEDERAHEAVDLFCYQIRKMIGAYSAVLGGVDSIIFSGGMGENAPRIRNRVVAGLEYLGVEIDDELNQQGSECISSETSRVGVHVFHTDEGRTIYNQVKEIIFNPS